MVLVGGCLVGLGVCGVGHWFAVCVFVCAALLGLLLCELFVAWGACCAEVGGVVCSAGCFVGDVVDFCGVVGAGGALDCAGVVVSLEYLCALFAPGAGAACGPGGVLLPCHVVGVLVGVLVGGCVPLVLRVG